MIPDKKSFITNFTQRFKGSSPDVDVLRQDKYWDVFIPNEHSGPCYMYTPPFDSDPGDTNNMYIIFNFSSKLITINSIEFGESEYPAYRPYVK